MIKEKITVSFAYNPIDNYWWLESDKNIEKMPIIVLFMRKHFFHLKMIMN